MDAPMAKGTKVSQVVEVFTGEVSDLKFNADSLTFEYLVSNTDAAGETHSRWFSAAQIEEVK